MEINKVLTMTIAKKGKKKVKKKGQKRGDDQIEIHFCFRWHESSRTGMRWRQNLHMQCDGESELQVKPSGPMWLHRKSTTEQVFWFNQDIRPFQECSINKTRENDHAWSSQREIGTRKIDKCKWNKKKEDKDFVGYPSFPNSPAA